jgi:PAS domain S-box-containing protein
MIWMSGPDRLCTYLNKGWLGFTGRTMEQELGNGWTDGVHPDDRQRCMEIYLSAFDGRRDFKMEYRLRRFDGEYRCILDHGTPRFLSDGSFQGYIGSCIDIAERKQAEDALQESQRALTTLMSNLPGMVYRCRNDRDWTMDLVSGGCLELTGYQPFEVVGNRKIAFARLIHAEDQESIWNEVQIALQERRPFQLVYRIITAAGEEKWVWEQGSGVFSADGNLQALEGFITDITERRRAREALQQERDFAESLIETAQVIILVLDNEGRIVRFNSYMEEISGYRLEEVQGKDWFSTFLPKRDQGPVREVFLKAIHDIKTRGNVNPIVTKDGHEREIEWYDKTLKDADGNTTGLISIGQDITERTRAETWLRTLIETTQDAIVSIDRSGYIVVFNPAAERIFGYTKAEALGKKIDILMTETDAGQHERYIARYEETGERKAIGRIRTLIARRKNGEEFPIELSLTELQTNEEVRYAAFIRDISDKARLQEQLVEKERLAAIGATTAKLAHEIGNPLNGMYLTVQLLQQQLARYDNTRDDRTVSTVTKLENEIIRLNRLLMEFRSLSRHEKYHFRPVSLVKILTDVLEMEKPRYAGLRIRVEQEFPDDLPVIVGDGDRLKQAFLNLCKNASEAMPDGGTLTVKAHRSGDGVMLEITDTGMGIPEGMDITRPFTSTKLQGSGIGLVVVRQIIAAHGGTLAYSSEVGQGTRCRLSLPFYPMSAEIE